MVRTERTVDRYIGSAIVFFLSLLKLFDSKPKERKRILLIKLWALGDSVLSLALAEGIKKKLGTDVDILCREKNKVVYESYPCGRVMTLENDMPALLRLRSYDLVFDTEPYLNLSAIISFLLGKERVGFSGQFRSRLYTKTVKFNKDQHMVENYLDMLRATGVEYRTDSLPRLNITKNKEIDNICSGKKMIGLCPGVAESAKNRMWYEDRFASLADRLSKKGYTIVFIDSKENSLIVKSIMSMMSEKYIDASGKYNLKDTFYLISKCKLFISNDTGPMHVAASLGVKTIGLFGPNTPTLWAPFGKLNCAIYKTKLTPSIENDKGIFKNVDREGYMGPITVDDVFSASMKML